MKVDVVLPMSYGDDICIEAELLTHIAPHLAMVSTFVLHESPSYGDWAVSNLETGLRVSHHKYKSRAIKAAAKRLASMDADDLRAAYRKARRKYKRSFQ